jgi:hypothetical protein
MYDPKTCKVVDRVLKIVEEFDRIIIAIVDVHVEKIRCRFVHRFRDNHQNYSEINE